MRHPFICCLLIMCFCLPEAARAVDTVSSQYTALDGNSCRKTIDDIATGAHTLTCPGAGGYRLQVVNDGSHSTVNLLAPGKPVFSLNYWSVVTDSMSSLGPRAEWRVRKEKGREVAYALIVSVHTRDRRKGRPKTLPVLAVAKLEADAACIVGRIDAGTRNASAFARRTADQARESCAGEMAQVGED